MEQLREIMGNFTEVEYHLESFSVVLKALEECYIYKCESDLAMNVHFYRTVVELLKKELGRGITEIDKFLLENKNK